jgi:hypothetical protein
MLINNITHYLAGLTNGGLKVYKTSSILYLLCDIDVKIPFYDGSDPRNRRGQNGIVKYFKFDCDYVSCTLNVVFSNPDKSGKYNAEFDYSIFTEHLSLEQRNKIEDFIEALAREIKSENK